MVIDLFLFDPRLLKRCLQYYPTKLSGNRSRSEGLFQFADHPLLDLKLDSFTVPMLTQSQTSALVGQPRILHLSAPVFQARESRRCQIYTSDYASFAEGKYVAVFLGAQFRLRVLAGAVWDVDGLDSIE